MKTILHLAWSCAWVSIIVFIFAVAVGFFDRDRAMEAARIRQHDNAVILRYEGEYFERVGNVRGQETVKRLSKGEPE